MPILFEMVFDVFHFRIMSRGYSYSFVLDHCIILLLLFLFFFFEQICVLYLFCQAVLIHRSDFLKCMFLGPLHWASAASAAAEPSAGAPSERRRVQLEWVTSAYPLVYYLYTGALAPGMDLVRTCLDLFLFVLSPSIGFFIHTSFLRTDFLLSDCVVFSSSLFYFLPLPFSSIC